MDTSETYIKMCEKAVEIQNASYDTTPEDFLGNGSAGCMGKSVWLPRQDQLQEILGDFGSNLSRIYWWVEQGTVKGLDGDDYWDYNRSQFTSMEQLWLAIVMKEKYNKVWDGETWTEANLSQR